MICRKCKAEIPDDTIRCPHCGVKVNIICPDCNTLNPFGTIHCRNCSKELIKVCPVCKSFNFSDAQVCRKCNTPFQINNDDIDKNLQTNTVEVDIVKPFSNQTNNLNLPNLSVNVQNVKNVSENTNTELYDNSNQEGEIFKVDDLDSINIETVDYEAVSDDLEPENALRNNVDSINIDVVEDLVVDVNDSIEEGQKNITQNTEQTQQEFINEYNIENIEIQSKAVNKTINLIRSSIKKHIIAINGNEGSGKSAVIKQVRDYLTDNGYICLYGSLTPLLQITSFGFFQDAFLRIMGFPPFIKNSSSFVKEFKKSKYAGLFDSLDSKELSLFLNMFYPSKEDVFENIIENKKIIFSIMEKVITSLLLNNNIVIAIDNFELLDGASYDFIVYLIERGYFNNRMKLLVGYQENKGIQSYFDIPDNPDDIFETIVLNKFTKEEMLKSLKRTTGVSIEDVLDEKSLNEIVEKSSGNAIRFEQEAALLFDLNYITIENEELVLKEENKLEITPDTFEELIKLRLNALAPVSKNMLFMAAVMGFRFSEAILFSALKIPSEKAVKMLDYLSKELYIDFIDNYTCEFKSLTLWKIIYKEAKADSLYKENSQRLYNVLKSLILSSNLQKAISCEEAINKDEKYKIWNNSADLAAKLGDTNLYIIAKKQCLKLLDEISVSEPEEVRAQIYEQMGKLLSEKSPKEAVTYLSNVLDLNIKNSDVNKIIDLSGYFVNSCYLSGNYFGVVEAVDAVISSLSGCEEEISALDLSLIKTRKLNALLNIGNSEQIINLVNEEIIPDIEPALNSVNPNSSMSQILIHAWIISKVVIAKAYGIQGNKEIFNVVDELRAFISKYNYNSEYYLTQTNILEAFANTISGEVNKSDDILSNISVEYKNKKMNTTLLAEWNLINIINRVLSEQTADLKADLFELAAFTNNINEHTLKNIVKLILGYILKEEGNKTKALEIFNEEIAYFAKEKIAIGAMLSWAFIVQITLDLGDYDKALNTSMKSLEIAQSSKINNYFFTVYFQKYISDIYLFKQDYIAAKMYLEKAVMVAKQFDLKYQLVELYISFGKYMEEFMQENKMYTQEYVKLTGDMYNKALNYAKELKLKNLIDLAVRERSSFKVYCQLNNIEYSF